MNQPHPLRTWRRENGRKTLAAVAAEVGVVPSHLSQIETGERAPSMALAVKLCGLTGLPLDAFSARTEGAAIPDPTPEPAL